MLGIVGEGRLRWFRIRNASWRQWRQRGIAITLTHRARVGLAARDCASWTQTPGSDLGTGWRSPMQEGVGLFLDARMVCTVHMRSLDVDRMLRTLPSLLLKQRNSAIDVLGIKRHWTDYGNISQVRLNCLLAAR